MVFKTFRCALTFTYFCKTINQLLNNYGGSLALAMSHGGRSGAEYSRCSGEEVSVEATVLLSVVTLWHELSFCFVCGFKYIRLDNY